MPTAERSTDHETWTRRYGVYVHVPYCQHICPYCDFNVVGLRGARWDDWLTAVLNEHRHFAPSFLDHRFSTIYVGGGTPSLAPVAVTHALLAALDARDAVEITIEANPNDLTEEKLRALCKAGVTRVSVGAQSFQDGVLKTLGRDHDGATAAHAVSLARAFAHTSVDLIVGAPGQALSDLGRDLDSIARLEPEHVSIYELTYHEGTLLERRRVAGRVTALDDDLVCDLLDHTREALLSLGYEQYEVSNFARPGFSSLHNQLYWRGGQWLGLGPGAHSLVEQDGVAHRWQSIVKPRPHAESWVAPRDSPAVEWSSVLSDREHLTERMVGATRCVHGTDMTRWRTLFGEEIDGHVRTAQQRGWATYHDGFLRPTALGLRFADSAAALFV